MTGRPIQEPLRSFQGGRVGASSYWLPVMVCDTCGQSTKNSLHVDCKRVKGKLVVRASTPSKVEGRC
jgi:hypothetical protein